MFVPHQFRADDRDRLMDFIEAHGFGLLMTAGPAAPLASQIPFLLDREKGTLIGHLARANPQAKALADGAEAAVWFSGPHSYISPRWADRQGMVPTWNYMAVEVRGPLTRVDDPAALAEVVGVLTQFYEAGAEAPWSPDELRAGMLDSLVKGIVGVRIEIREIAGKWKLSQNRSTEQRQGIIAGLRREEGDPGIIEAMVALETVSTAP